MDLSNLLRRAARSFAGGPGSVAGRHGAASLYASRRLFQQATSGRRSRLLFHQGGRTSWVTPNSRPLLVPVRLPRRDANSRRIEIID